MSNCKHLLTFGLFFLLLIPFLLCDELMGPADIDVKIIEKCAEDKFGVKFDLLRHKVNRTHLGTDGNLTLPFPLDDKIIINITIAKWGDGGWKPNFFETSQKDVCEFSMKYYPDDTKRAFEAIKHPYSCPIQAGEYFIRNHVYNGEMPIPVFYGDFRVDVLFLKDNIIGSCVRFYATTTPKKVIGNLGR